MTPQFHPTAEWISAFAAVVVPAVSGIGYVFWRLIRGEIREQFLTLNLGVEQRIGGVEQRVAALEGEAMRQMPAAVKIR